MMAREKRLESDFTFRLMTFIYKFRDLLRNPRKSLEKAQLRRGMSVVDYGCGPGSFTVPAAALANDRLADGRLGCLQHFRRDALKQRPRAPWPLEWNAMGSGRCRGLEPHGRQEGRLFSYRLYLDLWWAIEDSNL